MLLATSFQLARGGENGPRFLIPLVLLALVGLFIWWLRRRRSDDGTGPRRHGSALQTLQERFARGEIDHGEFEHRKAVLIGADVIPPARDQSPPEGDNSTEE